MHNNYKQLGKLLKIELLIETPLPSLKTGAIFSVIGTLRVD
jgi:hypothetical protein